MENVYFNQVNAAVASNKRHYKFNYLLLPAGYPEGSAAGIVFTHEVRC